jgi:hypothetical protein
MPSGLVGEPVNANTCHRLPHRTGTCGLPMVSQPTGNTALIGPRVGPLAAMRRRRLVHREQDSAARAMVRYSLTRTSQLRIKVRSGQSTSAKWLKRKQIRAEPRFARTIPMMSVLVGGLDLTGLPAGCGRPRVKCELVRSCPFPLAMPATAAGTRCRPLMYSHTRPRSRAARKRRTAGPARRSRSSRRPAVCGR